MYLDRLSISNQEKWAHINVWILRVDVWLHMMLEVSIIPPVSWEALRRRENSLTNRIFSPGTPHCWSVLNLQSENKRLVSLAAPNAGRQDDETKVLRARKKYFSNSSTWLQAKMISWEGRHNVLIWNGFLAFFYRSKIKKKKKTILKVDGAESCIPILHIKEPHS